MSHDGVTAVTDVSAKLPTPIFNGHPAAVPNGKVSPR
jgi:hypothetical protein